MVSVRDDRGSAGKTEGGYVNAPPSVTLTPWPPFCGAGTLDWAQPATRLANRRLPHRNTGTDQLQLAQAIHHFAKYNVPMWALPHHTQFTGTSTLVAAAAAAKHSIDTAAAAATHDGHPPVTLPVFITRNTASRLFSTLCVGCPLIQCLLGSPGWVHFQNYNQTCSTCSTMQLNSTSRSAPGTLRRWQTCSGCSAEPTTSTSRSGPGTLRQWQTCSACS